MDPEWEFATVADLETRGLLLVQDGNHGAYRPQPDEIVADGVPHIRAADIADDGSIDTANAQRVAESAWERIKKGRARGGDVLLTHKGTVGRVAVVPGHLERVLCSPQTTFWRSLNDEVIRQRFIAAFLRSGVFHAQLRQVMHETDMAPYVSLTNQRKLLISIPPVKDQQAIADVLGALDDKIESNRRVAERLAGVVLMSATNGAVASTRTRTLAELGTQIKTPGHTSQPYVGLDVMPRGGAVLQEWIVADGPTGASWAFEPGDVLFGKLRPYFRKVAIASIAGRCTREIVVLRPSEERYYGLLLATVASQSFIDFCTAVSTGTKMPRAEWKDASRFKVGMPDDRTLAAQTHLARINYAAAAGLVHEARSLTAIRGELLPKLVSGQIRIPLSDDVEEGVGAAIEALA